MLQTEIHASEYSQTSLGSLRNRLIGSFGIDTGRPNLSLLNWTRLNREYIRTGIKFDLTDHHYLEAIYNDDAKELVIYKAAQMGASEFAISFAIYVCDALDGTTLYLFPTNGDVSDFSSGRIGPAIEASPYLISQLTRGDKTRRGADRITLMRIRNSFLYLRGAQVKADGKASQLKTVAADAVIYDELDEMDSRALELGEKRLGHSRLKLQRYISTPTYPGIGIHSKWDISDQKEWCIKCPKCNHYQPLNIRSVILEFDQIGRPIEWNGKKQGQAYAACGKCGNKLDRLASGKWVAKYPSREISGYHLTKVFSFTSDLDTIIENIQTTDETKRREGYNQDWGETFTPSGTRITDTLLESCKRDYLPPETGESYNNVVMGIDVGSILNVVIRGGVDFETGERPLLYAGEVDFPEIMKLKRRYRVGAIVIDALPETRKARELQEAIEKDTKGGRCYVYLCYYAIQSVGSKQESSIQINKKEKTINSDRTRTLDETFALFLDQENTLPENIKSIPNYYSQMTSLIRIIQINRRGEGVATYIHSSADHYAHAENYCMIASRIRPQPASGKIITPKPIRAEQDRNRRSSWR